MPNTLNTDAINIAIKAVQLYAETHPRPPQVTQVQAAAMLDLSVSTVRRLIDYGTLRLNDCGLIPITQIDRALAER